MSGAAPPAPLAAAAAVTPLAVSLAANITWGWLTGSWVLIVAGVVTPLLLVLAIERWRVLPEVGTRWLRWTRAVAMASVVVVVAGWSWLHATALLLDAIAPLHAVPPAPGLGTVMRHAETALCVAAPLAVDGLAVLSVLALPTGRTSPPIRAADGGAEQTGPGQGDRIGADQTGREQQATGPEPGPDRIELTDAGERELVDRIAQAHARGAVLPSGRQLRRDHGIGPDRAARILADARAAAARTGPRAVGS